VIVLTAPRSIKQHCILTVDTTLDCSATMKPPTARVYRTATKDEMLQERINNSKGELTP
jgi:hypothetical protein